MELSIAYELYMKPHDVPTQRAMKIVSEAGFHYVDMSIGPFCTHPNSPILQPNWEAWAEQTVQTAKENNIIMHQAHCLLFDFMNKNTPDHQYYTDVNMKLLDVCKALGIEYMIFHPGTMPNAVSRRESLQGTKEFLLPFVERAEKLGVKLCIENEFDDLNDKTLVRIFGARADELVELVEQLDNKNVGICWDCGHAHISMLDQKKSLQILGDKLWTTHIHDNRGQYNNDLHLPPFYGSVCWEDVMQGLKMIDYNGTLNFEIEPHTVPLDFMPQELCAVYQKGQRLLQML